MFTEKELDTLRSCWILTDGKLFGVPAESHDSNLPDGYYNENWDINKSIREVEKKCLRMSFWWGWSADISQMTIHCELTEPQKQIIRYLLMSKIIKWQQIEYYGNNEDDFYALLDEVENELKK